MPTMTTAVLIGMKHLDAAKSRLAPELDGDARRALMRVMLSRVAAAAREAAIGQVALVSSDPGAPALASELGIDFSGRRRPAVERGPPACTGRGGAAA